MQFISKCVCLHLAAFGCKVGISAFGCWCGALRQWFTGLAIWRSVSGQLPCKVQPASVVAGWGSPAGVVPSFSDSYLVHQSLGCSVAAQLSMSQYRLQQVRWGWAVLQ